MNFSRDLQFSSRAVDEDDEYGEEEKQDEMIRVPVVRWSPNARFEMSSSAGFKCTSLLVAIGSAATAFFDKHLLKKRDLEIIGAGCMGFENHRVSTLIQEASNDPSCFIYRLVNHPDVVIVQCKVNISTEQFFVFTEQVMSKLCSPQTAVTVLTTSSAADYKSPLVSSDLPLSFLRYLKSNKCSSQVICPPLEQPNIISGLSAQILTYCQSCRLSCLLYISFSDTHCVHSEAIKAFEELLSCSPFKNILHQQNSDQEQNHFHETEDNHVLLYS